MFTAQRAGDKNKGIREKMVTPHNPRNLRNAALKAGLERVPRADKGAFAFNVTPG